MTHTPGPWTYDEWVIGADGTTICDPHYDTQDIDEREANARLIAAAPDLLAVCHALVCQDPLTYGEDAPLATKQICNLFNSIRESAVAAIAKAEGTEK